MGAMLICAIVQMFYRFCCHPCSGLFHYQHQIVMFIVTDGIVDVRIRLAVAHFVPLEKPLMACVYNYRLHWLIHHPENPELAAMKSCISNPYWTSGCCKVLLVMWETDRWTDTAFGSQKLFLLCVCSHCPLSLDSLRNSVSLQALVTGNTSSWAGLCSCALAYGAVFGSACCFSELYQALWHTHLPGSTTESKENTLACPMARLRARLCPEHIGDKVLRVWCSGSWCTVGLLKTCSSAMSPALSLALK